MAIRNLAITALIGIGLALFTIWDRELRDQADDSEVFTDWFGWLTTAGGGLLILLGLDWIVALSLQARPWNVVLEPKHPNTITSRNNLAAGYRAAGPPGRADRLLGSA